MVVSRWGSFDHTAQRAFPQSRTLTVCLHAQGWRPARPGEFTRRAVISGKLDLTGAEGLADLLAAETPHQRRQALAQASGAMARLYDTWQGEVLRCLAHAEAVVDFGEEAHLSASVMHDVILRTQELRNTLTAHLDSGIRAGGAARSYELATGSVRITLGGAPNAGKSSLFNALLGRDAAIVAPTAGTTRDVVTHHVALGPAETAVAMADTAGLRHAKDDDIEAEGVVRAAAALRESHVRVLVIDADAVMAGRSCVPDAQLWAPVAHQGAISIVVLNKADLLVSETRRDVPRVLSRLPPWVQQLVTESSSSLAGIAGPWLVSTRTGHGLDQLTLALARAAAAVSGGGQTASSHPSALVPAVTRARHAHALRAAVSHLDAAIQAGTRSGGDGAPARDELMAEELRSAHVALCSVTGRVHCTEDVLDIVFADFCIGK